LFSVELMGRSAVVFCGISGSSESGLSGLPAHAWGIEKRA